MKSKATQSEVELYCLYMGLEKSDGEYIFTHWQENDWRRGGKKIRNWQLCIKAWALAGYFPSQRKRAKEEERKRARPSKQEISRVIREYKDRMVGSRDNSVWDKVLLRECGLTYDEAMKVLE